MNWESGALLGGYTTRSFGEYPKEENASRLSQILEECAPPKYYLSERACRGILTRAARRDKLQKMIDEHPILVVALLRQAHWDLTDITKESREWYQNL